MWSSRPNAVFTFETPRQALAAEEVLRRARIHYREVPPPDEAEAGCAVAVRIRLNAMYKAIEALATDNAEWLAVYQLGDDQEGMKRLG